MSWPTTRRYHRTLASAFPQDSAPAITHYRRPGLGRAGFILAALIGASLAMCIAWELAR